MKIIGCNNASGLGEMGLKQNIDTLMEKYPHYKIERVVEPDFQREEGPSLLHNFETVFNLNQQLAKSCQAELAKGETLLNIIGDHSAGIGTVAATSSISQQLGVIWIDAHSDINTEKTSPSGNIHGMPLASLLNLTENELNNILFDGPKVKPEHLVYIGLRDVDPGEQEVLDRLNILYFNYATVMEMGFFEVLAQTFNRLANCDVVHVSLDMDSMNPEIVTAVSVPVADGFTPDEVEYILQNLLMNLPIRSIDIAEYNPEYDVEFKSLEILNDLIESIGGFYEAQS